MPMLGSSGSACECFSNHFRDVIQLVCPVLSKQILLLLQYSSFNNFPSNIRPGFALSLASIVCENLNVCPSYMD